ncbi:MAG: hypothetical protein WCJ92_02665 [Alphaproteobacteria bacterium]
MKMLKTALVIIIATIKLSATTTPIETTDPRFNGKTPQQLKQIAVEAMNALAAGGGGAGPALPSEIRALVQCVNTNTCDPYIAIAKEKIKAELAKDTVIPASVGKGALLDQLNGFIDGLNNGNLGVAIPGAGAAAMGGNPAANEVKTLNALKCAIDVAMVQKVNAKMDELGVAGAQPIKEALLAVFAGR